MGQVARTERTRRGIDRREGNAHTLHYLNHIKVAGFKDRRVGKERRTERDLESPEDYAELDRVLRNASKRTGSGY